jgi:hypothetical protein
MIKLGEIYMRYRLFALVCTFIVLGYFAAYIYLRINHDLIHKYTTGNGNEIVPGDFNPGIYLFSPDINASYQRDVAMRDAITWVFYPARKIECVYHDVFYRYEP